MSAVPEERIRPGRAGYWIAALILLIGGGLSGWLAYQGFSGITEGLVRAVVPGETDITLNKAGTWTVFHESPSVLNGQTYNSPIPNGAEISLRSDGGGDIPMSFSTGNFNYDLGGRSGVSIGSFRIDQVGTYTLIGEWPPAVPSGDTVVALGHEKGKATIKTVLGFVGLFVSAAISSVIFLVVIILRSRSKNRLREQGAQV